MNFFIAVIFMCASANDCVFWKSEEKYYDQAECELSVHQAMNALPADLYKVSGVCLPIDPDKGQT